MHRDPLSPTKIHLPLNPGPRPVAAVAAIPEPVSLGFGFTTSPEAGGNVQVLDDISYDPQRQVAVAGGVPAAMSNLRGTSYDTEHDGLSFPDKD